MAYGFEKKIHGGNFWRGVKVRGSAALRSNLRPADIRNFTNYLDV